MELRPYQQKAVDQIRDAYRRGSRAPLFVLPCGGGKTVVFSHITESAASKGKRVCIVVHREELLKQASSALTKNGVPHGLIAPSFHHDGNAVCVASIQTLSRRIKKEVVPFDLIIFDEAHHAVAKTWSTIINAYPRARFLGVTATPVRTDGRGLGVSSGSIFTDLILGPSVSELISLGHLAKPRVFGPAEHLNLTGIKRVGGDFDRKALANAINKRSITGDAVEHYKKICPGLTAVGYCVNIEHAIQAAQEFNEAGFKFGVLHGKLKTEDRERVIDELESGKLHGIMSVDIVTEGFNLPRIKCMIGLRPTQSEALYIQMTGRPMRPTPCGSEAIILDHAGNFFIHGMPDDDREWSLEGSSMSQNKSADGIRIRQCEKCFEVYEWADECPSCGHKNVTPPRKIARTQGELREITREERERLKAEKKAKADRMRAARTPEDIERVARENGYRPGWIYQRKKALGLL